MWLSLQPCDTLGFEHGPTVVKKKTTAQSHCPKAQSHVAYQNMVTSQIPMYFVPSLTGFLLHSLVCRQQTDPLSSAPLRIDQSLRNKGPTNKVRHACAYLCARGRVVQKGIGEPHVSLLTRASGAEPTGSVYCLRTICASMFGLEGASLFFNRIKKKALYLYILNIHDGKYT